MTRIRFLAGAFVLALALSVSCGKSKSVAPVDSGTSPDSGAAGSGGGGMGGADAGLEVAAPGDGKLGPCLDQPGELPRPPAGTLPCELIPPGFAL